MHMWDESVAFRDSQEVGSCLLAFLKDHGTAATHMIAYSDSCGGHINIVASSYTLCVATTTVTTL